LSSVELSHLHASEQITVLEAVAIDHFCLEFIEGCELPPSVSLAKAIRIWGLEVFFGDSNDSKKLLEALEALQAHSFGNGDRERSFQRGEFCSYVVIEDLAMGIHTLNGALDLVYEDDCSDAEFVRYCAVYSQQHLLDQGPFLPDRDWLDFQDQDQIEATTASLDSLVQFCRRKVSKRQVQARAKALFESLKSGKSYCKDLASREVKALSQKPRIGCPWLYSGRLKQMIYYELAYRRSMPRVQQKTPQSEDFAALFFGS